MHVHKFSGTSLGKYEPKFIFHLAVLKKYIKKGWSLLYMPVKFLENPSLDIKVIISILLIYLYNCDIKLKPYIVTLLRLLATYTRGVEDYPGSTVCRTV